MNKLTMVMVLAAGLIAPMSAVADGALKIGYVDGQRLTQDAPQTKAASESLAKEFERRENEIKEVQGQLRERLKQLDKESASLSGTERLQRERKLDADNANLQKMQREFRTDLETSRQQALAKVKDALRTAIQGYGKREGYDLILYEGGVAYASDRINLNDEILKRLKASK